MPHYGKTIKWTMPVFFFSENHLQLKQHKRQVGDNDFFLNLFPSTNNRRDDTFQRVRELVIDKKDLPWIAKKSPGDTVTVTGKIRWIEMFAEMREGKRTWRFEVFIEEYKMAP
jgi:hypothetical protein